MSNADRLSLLLFFVALVFLVGLAELIRRLLKWSSEATRKLVHILVGILVAATPFILESMWPMVILGLLFTVVDFIAIHRGWLRGMHGTARRTYGTVFYPLSFVILTVTLWNRHKLILVAAMLIMAIADAAAAVAGEKAKRPIKLAFGPETKSVQGSLAMFVATWTIVFACLLFAGVGVYILSFGKIVWIALVVALVATMAELVSIRGSDNLTVPLFAAFSMFYLLTESTQAGAAFTLGMGLALLIGLISYKLRFLDGGGSVALFLLGTLIFGVGRWAFSIPILAFFILSSLLSKMGKSRKAKLLTIFEKSGRRDAGQVLANGGVAGLMLLLWYFSKIDFVYVLYIASLAAVTADTWATEIGVMAKGRPRSVLNWKPVAMGTSGGITVLGTLGSALGSLVIVAIGFLCSPHASPRVLGWREGGLVLLAGVLAGFVDSLLGATVQAQFECPSCGKTTERKSHCAAIKTRLVRGFLWINNDVVNSLCAASGVFFVWIIWIFT